MFTWEEFANAEPDMAKVLRSMLGWIPIAYIATVRRNGSPRVHPFVPIFATERIYIAIPDWSPKRYDLRRDGRFAMHALPGKRDDEFYMTGRASLIEDDDTRILPNGSCYLDHLLLRSAECLNIRPWIHVEV